MSIIDRVMSMAVAASGAAVTLAVDLGAVSSQVGADIGVLVAALVVGYHGGSYVSGKLPSSNSETKSVP